MNISTKQHRYYFRLSEPNLVKDDHISVQSVIDRDLDGNCTLSTRTAYEVDSCKSVTSAIGTSSAPMLPPSLILRPDLAPIGLLAYAGQGPSCRVPQSSTICISVMLL